MDDVADDEFDLQRFVTAQNEGGTYAAALDELRRGRKTTHWMWFVFPQIQGLGSSPTSRYYAITGLDEARNYLAHPVLGPRLKESCAVLLASAISDAEVIFGPVDAQKLHSSMTLFALAAPADATFPAVLDKYFGGSPDEKTRARAGGVSG